MITTLRTRIGLPLAALAALATLSACSGSDSSGDRTSDDKPSAAASYAADSAGGDAPAREADVGALSTSADQVEPGQAKAERLEPESTVIATGTVSLESDDVGKTRFDVRKIIDQHQGSITEQETTTGDEGEVDTARIVVRVPSKEYADATTELEKVATLTDSTSSAEDVGAEIVDVAARVRSQRKSVARIEALLARAKDLSEIVSIETQLANRQADLDALLSRQKYLADQTSFSTITVHIEQAVEPGKKKDTDAGFLGGLDEGWDAFVGALVGALTVLGFLLPWLGLLALVLFPVWLVVRRRPRAAVAVPPAPQP